MACLAMDPYRCSQMWKTQSVLFVPLLTIPSGSQSRAAQFRSGVAWNVTARTNLPLRQSLRLNSRTQAVD